MHIIHTLHTYTTRTHIHARPYTCKERLRGYLVSSARETRSTTKCVSDLAKRGSGFFFSTRKERFCSGASANEVRAVGCLRGTSWAVNGLAAGNKRAVELAGAY